MAGVASIPKAWAAASEVIPASPWVGFAAAAGPASPAVGFVGAAPHRTLMVPIPACSTNTGQCQHSPRNQLASSSFSP